MTKNRNRIDLWGWGIIAMVAVMTLAACSDSFLDEKKNYDNVNTDIYNTYVGSERRVEDVYSWCLPDANAGANWKYNTTGLDDAQGKSTEEYAGFSVFVDPQNELSSMNGTIVPDYFHNQSNNIQASVWGRIRNINDVIQGIESGSLSQEEKDELLGQVYFFRAWCYYQMVKWYGGVPIVTEVQEATEASYTPRSSARQCIEFILSDLDKSARMLAPFTMSGQWSTGENWGRVTTGTALALKGRVQMLWASPLFNRTNDESRWNKAYAEMEAELDSINACGYGLYNPSGNVNGSNFAKLFTLNQSSEAVFVTLYNTVSSGDGQKNNNYERYIRPANTGDGSTGKTPSSMLVDLFPMADGKIPAGTGNYTKLATSDSTYDQTVPFYGRDPRFYRTFAFPGFRWAFDGDATQDNSMNPDYDGGHNYVLWNYVWYTDVNDQGDPESGNSYGADNLLSGKRGVYVRKRSDDYDINTSPLYSYTNSFSIDAAPYIEIRYAEVLLNLAEVACGAGKLDRAVDLLKMIRARAGYTAANNYGLQADLASDQATCMSAILYERQIELAYEGKRFDDLRRWLLFDGGTAFSSVDGAPSGWTLTGWSGNTCTWLGFAPLNGQRRETMEFRLADRFGVGGTTYDSDPLIADYARDLASQEGVTTDSIIRKYSFYGLARQARTVSLDLRRSLDGQEEQLRSWYKANLVRKEKKGDGRDANHVDLYMHFYPKYYFLGFTQGALSNDQQIEQTIGWADSNRGGANGTFDPLAE